MRDNMRRPERHLLPDERGISLIMAVLALVLLTSMGILLLFITQTDVQLGQTDLSIKRSFYGAEAGLEHGREELRQWNIASGTVDLDDEIAQAAGTNGVIDFDIDAVEPVFDSNGNITGFTGTGDDVPLRPLTTYNRGTYATYLTNDPEDGRTNLIDGNKKLSAYGLAVSDQGSFEKVEAVVDAFDAIPRPAAAITLLGDDPEFQGGTAAAKQLSGDDCWGAGVPGLSVPVVGVIGAANELEAEDGVDKPDTFTSGGNTGIDTVDDISSTIDPRWTDCEFLVDMARNFKSIADVVGNASTPDSQFGVPGNPKLVFIEDDYDLGGNFHGAGALWITGFFQIQGTVAWDGPIFVIGTGQAERYGAGNDQISGGIVVANVSGPDGILFTADDCAGPDDTPGTADDGLGDEPTWNVSGSGTGDTVYCTNDLDIFSLRWPFDVIEFRQR